MSSRNFFCRWSAFRSRPKSPHDLVDYPISFFGIRIITDVLYKVALIPFPGPILVRLRTWARRYNRPQSHLPGRT